VSKVVAACLAATLSFWAYTQTLLPGVDPGDTGGFQAAVLWPEVSARQAYPLYYGLARPFVSAAAPANPARALNLFSAIAAAAAVGLLVFACAAVTGSLAAGIAAGGLLATSYTFWSQAVIAEVYTLHLALLALCLVLLRRFETTPSLPRVALFFVVYALAFGNHLATILLLVPFGVFLVHTSPSAGWVFRPAVVGTAVVALLLGALQYAPNFLSVWESLSAPAALADRAAAFWFDTTKQDWRESMVLGIGGNQVTDRLAMWWFDTRQQFGVGGAVLGLAGVAVLWRTAKPWAVLAASAYAINTVFAFTYNVGDTHVFFLPGHLITAFCAGAAVSGGLRMWGGRCHVRQASLTRHAPQAVMLVAVILYVGWRGWTTWPAVDRHNDRRAENVIARLTLGLGEDDALLVSDMNWQLENVLLYTSRWVRQDLAWIRMGDVLPHWPFLVDDNRGIGRDIVLTPRAAAGVVAAYGPAYPLVQEAGLPLQDLAQAAAAVPRGMPYVLAVLTPPRDEHLDPGMLAAALQSLTGGGDPHMSGAAFEVIAGMAGEQPVVHRRSDRPFTERMQIAEEALTLRMDAWLPTDTFRRAGFGHVLRGREHVMILERGANLVWFAADGTASQPYYWASLFALQPRYRLPADTLQFARRSSLRPDP
jgi:hypothetical protein